MKSFILKYKNTLSIFLISFSLYFILGIIFTHYFGSYKYWSVILDSDCPRVFGDLSIVDYNHQRVMVHPLFVIIFQPLVKILDVFINDPSITIVIIQSIIASISLILINKLIKKITNKKNIQILGTILFAFNLGQIIYSSIVETYIYAQLFLCLLWYFVYCKIDKKMRVRDYAILIALGIGSLAVTITNFMQFIIALVFLILLNKNVNKKIVKFILVIIAPIGLSIILSEIQHKIWPSAPNFFIGNIMDFFYGTSQESLYIDLNINFKSILNILNTLFAHQFGIVDISLASYGKYLKFNFNILSSMVSVILFITLIIALFIFFKKEVRNLDKHKFLIALLLTLIFNIILHIFYGNETTFLYICHFNFIFLLIIIYLLNYFNLLKSKRLLVGICALVILLAIRFITIIFINYFEIFNLVRYYRMLPFIIFFISTSIFLIITIKKIYIKIILIILLFLILAFSWYKLNDKINCQKDSCTEFEVYQESLNEYEYQLKEMRSIFGVRSYNDSNEDLNIFFFGMGDREKFVYKNGNLINIKNQETILTFDYVIELIIPNEYTVLLEDKFGNIHKIFENEYGIYYSNNGETLAIDESDEAIVLPEFEKHKYSELLKVLHQEILFNIDNQIPKPNLFYYDSAQYRGTMMASMVLEYTANINLLIPWIEKIDNIYDGSQSKNSKNADNLGELLYIIGATGVDRNDLVKEILEEIDNLKQDDGLIKSKTDNFNQTYYPTIVALYGAKKLGIDLDLNVPKIDDGYAKLTWYSDFIIQSSKTINQNKYPYLNWAFYHYSGDGKLYILNEIYPLSYEYVDSKVNSECFISSHYCQNTVLTHMWSAAEMFLLLSSY